MRALGLSESIERFHMPLYLSIEEGNELIKSGWEVSTFDVLYDHELYGYLVYPKLDYLLKITSKSTKDSIKVTVDDVYALKLLDVDMWNYYLSGIKKE